MSLEVQREVVRWKLEGRLEDNVRYFYPPPELSRVRSGDCSFVIGRKGAGKTAISEHLYRSAAATTFTAKLTFKNFPFNDLYSLTHDSYRPPNQYITLWKYLIYSSVAKMMATNEAVNAEIRVQLQRAYADDPTMSLPRVITRWTSKAFMLSVMGTGISGNRQITREPNLTPWTERVSVLEGLIEQYLDDAEYLVVFDELDEDYGAGAVEVTDQYWQLLTSLFKAVQDVRATFRSADGCRIFPVVFLREDIYSQIKDADKTKWEDVILRLEWTPPKIQELLAFRISRAAGLDGRELPFGEAWAMLFGSSDVRFGRARGRRLSAFDFITRAGCWRPRDYVRYLKATAERAISTGVSPVTSEMVFQAQKEFSDYLRGEMVDEIGGMLSDIEGIMNVVAHIRQTIFTVDEFRRSYESGLARGEVVTPNWEDVLRQLFHFSVLGNWTDHGTAVFRYTNRTARLNQRESLIVHPGLLRAFQI